jgi:sugar lactone lactonase YvrE
MREVIGSNKAGALGRGLRSSAQLARFVWLLGCAGAATDVSSKPEGSTSGGGAGAAASSGAGASGTHAGPAGSAAGSSGAPLGGGSGTISAGSGGAITAGGGGTHVAGTSGDGGVGMGGSEPEAGTDGIAGSDGGDGGSGPVDPASYPTLDASAIGSPTMITTGFTLAESPLWDHCSKQLLFVDVQGGAGSRGAILTMSPDGMGGVLLDGTTNTNGIAFDIDGSIIMSVMGGGGHLARRDKAGTVTNIEPADGTNLHTPDDVTVRADGTIYFSDGDFYPIGNLLGSTSLLPVFILKPGATALENAGTVSGPNGIEFAPGEQTLYVSAYGSGVVQKFAVADDGSLTKGDPLISGLTENDSMCVDAAGNVYIGVSTGLQVVRPDGMKVKLIPIPSETTSCGFGGTDGKTLYITSWTTLYKVEGMPIPGNDWVVNKQRVPCN